MSRRSAPLAPILDVALLLAACSVTPSPTATATTPSTNTASPATATTTPPDLDCKDVLPHKRFRVLQPDPHKFDADKNGIGCET